MKYVAIKYKGIDLNVGGIITKGIWGGFTEAPTYKEFEIHSVYIPDSQINIIDLFDDEIELLEELALENV